MLSDSNDEAQEACRERLKSSLASRCSVLPSGHLADVGSPQAVHELDETLVIKRRLVLQPISCGSHLHGRAGLGRRSLTQSRIGTALGSACTRRRARNQGQMQGQHERQRQVKIPGNDSVLAKKYKAFQTMSARLFMTR